MKYEAVLHQSLMKITDKSILLDELFAKSMKRYEGYVKVMITLPYKSRTTGEGSQNHHLNGHIQTIAQETGNDFDDVKKYVKQQAISAGYPMLMKDGQIVLDMWGSPVGISESDCSSEECALLIDAAHRLAAELGIMLPEGK